MLEFRQLLRLERLPAWGFNNSLVESCRSKCNVTLHITNKLCWLFRTSLISHSFLDANFTIFIHRYLNRSDSDSSLCISQTGEQLRLSYSSKSFPVKPTSLLHGPNSRFEEGAQSHAHNGGNRVQDGGTSPDGVSESPILMKKVYSIEKSASMSEILGSQAVMSMSESSRSLSPNSTEPDTPSPTGLTGGKAGNRIPQIPSKKSPLEEDSGSTGEETDSAANRKKHTFKIFKKQKK